jgi:hypothetical protein
MPFSQEAGYTPASIETILLGLMEGINEQFGTSYDEETFVGTNFYKYFYSLAQRMQENEISTSEIFAKLTQYIALTNERISRPVVTNPGLIEKLENEGYIASVKKMIEEDAGKIHIAVDVDDGDDDYAAQKLEICTIIKDSTAAGTVTMGDQVESIVLSNGQSFDFKYALPDRIEIFLRLTVTLSDNNQVVVGSIDDIKQALLANIAARYRLGKNFEPQKYFSLADAPWASQVLLEHSEDEETWSSAVYEAEFDELFDIDLARIEVVEN